VNVTMSQKLSLLQSANSVSRALTADSCHHARFVCRVLFAAVQTARPLSRFRSWNLAFGSF
jgi:hypothetical protein